MDTLKGCGRKRAMTSPNASPPERIIRLTVDMPESLHQQLSQVANQRRKKKAGLVRFAISQMLKDLDDDAVIG